MAASAPATADFSADEMQTFPGPRSIHYVGTMTHDLPVPDPELREQALRSLKKKRDFRSLWIVRIGAAARVNGLNYSQFMHGLSLAGIELDRKVLADLAANSPEAFAELAGQARSAIENKPQAAA